MLCLTCVAALALDPMTATIRVSNGSLYDYVVIGEHHQAADGFDNPYDTISPGNLNADMGQPFISVIISHPEWKQAMREMRGDIRSLAKIQEWHLQITSSLPKGTPLTVALQTAGDALPQGVKLTLRHNQKEIDLKKANFTLPAPGSGKASKLLVIAEQP
jgi:hypothetical protein